MLEHAYAVILAGGRGERFWPLSVASRPKQFLKLLGNKTLLEHAVDRLRPIIPPERVLVITNGDLVDTTAAAIPDLPYENIVGEPFGRDTAAAVALALALVKQRDPEGCFAVLTADHVIGDLPLFHKTLEAGLALALAEDVLLTIGVQPTEPSTGYGYIHATSQKGTVDGIEFLKAERFVEKPDHATAEKYLSSGEYFWNSGMFMWSVASLEKGLRAHRPQLSSLLDRMSEVIGTGEFLPALEKEYGNLEKISIDYALMEKSDNIIMAKGTFAWDDVGAWPALENHFEKNEDGNVVLGSCEAVDADGNIVVSEGRLTALVGVKDMVVVHANDVTLICPKNQAQDVKKLVLKLRDAGNYDGVL
ncbi:MAG: NTP transferase domain-containing protein [Verrucomicrobia bacterium]|nr:NTP transferase domain-containing protein [Verrucomicrobiota bacterium]